MPELLLGLYAALLLFSLGLGSWVGSGNSPPESARRAGFAAERAALLHLSTSGRLLAPALALWCCGAAVLGQQGGHWAWGLLAPFCSLILLSAALFYCGRKLLRAAAQLTGARSADERLTISSRTVLSSVLCIEATVSLLLLTVQALAANQLSAPFAQRLVLMTAASLGLLSALLARSLATGPLTVGATSNQPGPHPLSLAQLVAGAFLAPMQRLLSLVSLSSFGHCAHLRFADSGAAELLGTFPHLLRILGLLALVFGTLVARTTEDESPAAGWLRGGLVTLVLLVASGWSLSALLPTPWLTVIPATLSFFFLVLAGYALIGRQNQSSRVELSLSGLLERVYPTLGALALLALLALSFLSYPADTVVPTALLTRVLTIGALCLSPLFFVWLIARDLAAAVGPACALSYLPSPARLPLPLPESSKALPLISTLVVLGTLLGVFFAPGHQLLPELWGLGLFSGATLLVGLLALAERSVVPSRSTLTQLLSAHLEAKQPPLELNLESAVDECRSALATFNLRFQLTFLGPALVLVSGLLFFAPEHVLALLAGLAVGAALTGLGLSWAFCASRRGEERSLGELSHTTSIGQALCILTLSALLMSI